MICLMRLIFSDNLKIIGGKLVSTYEADFVLPGFGTTSIGPFFYFVAKYPVLSA